MNQRILVGFGILISLGVFGSCTYDAPTFNGSGGSGGSASIASSSSSTGNGGETSASSTGQTSSSGSTGSSGQTSSSSSGSASSSSTGSSGQTSSSSSGGEPTFMVHCGPQGTCTTPNVCCTDQNPMSTPECLVPFNCDITTKITVSCDGPEDCLGGSCCGTWNPNTMRYTNVGCDKNCAAPNFVICHFGDTDPGCPVNTMCHPEMLLGPSYGYCQ